MNSSLGFWADISLRAVTATAATVVATYVAIISRRQWTTNQEKLRLDLFQRRFDIFLRVLEFHWALLEWKDEPEQQALQGPFVKAFCESRFMFPEESGIHAFLNEFHLHAFRVTHFKSASDPIREVMPAEFLKLANQRTQDLNWILNSMDIFLAKLAPYLNFHSL